MRPCLYWKGQKTEQSCMTLTDRSTPAFGMLSRTNDRFEIGGTTKRVLSPADSARIIQVFTVSSSNE